MLNKYMKPWWFTSLRIGTTPPILRDAMPDGSTVGTSGGKKILVWLSSAVVCASRAKRAARNKKIFYLATDVRRRLMDKGLSLARFA
jgi:hypothetical protein